MITWEPHFTPEVREQLRQEDFSQADKDRLIRGRPFGYVINRGVVDTKTPYYGLKRDWAYPDCYLVLVNAFDSGCWVRYHRNDIVVVLDNLSEICKVKTMKIVKASTDILTPEHCSSRLYYGLEPISRPTEKGFITRTNCTYIALCVHGLTNGNEWDALRNGSFSEFLRKATENFDVYQFETSQELFAWLREA